MTVKELKFDGGSTDMRVSDINGHIAFKIETRIAFRGDTTQRSMLAMLDRHQQHLLMMYLRERLER